MATTERQTPTPSGKKRRKPVGKKTSTRKTSSPKKTPKATGSGFLGKSPFSLVIYGPPGVGKTSFAANFPKPGFIIDPQEEGIKTLTEFNRCPEAVFVEEAGDFDSLLDMLKDVAAGDYDIETLVLDSLTGFEKLCFISHCEEYFDGDWSSKGFYSYFQGPKNAAKVDWPKFLDALDAVRKSGVNVVLIAHSAVKSYNNPEGADYDRFNAYLDKEIWQATHRWAKAVLFYNFHVEVDKKGVRNKAKIDTEARFIYCDWSPAFDAKNQYGLDPVIDAGEDGTEAFEAFKKAYATAAGSS